MDEPNTQYSPIKEFREKWWTERIKPFLDFNEYLTQRREILLRPEIILDQHSPEDNKWQSPLKFALRGLAVPTILFQLVVGVYFFFVKEPAPIWNDTKVQYSENIKKLRDLEQQIEQSSPNQTFTFFDDFKELKKDEALQKSRNQITKLESRRWLIDAAPHVDSAKKKLNKILTPFMLIIAAYFFRYFLKFGQGRNGKNIDRAHEVYLYFVTSCVFWITLIDSFCIQVVILGARTNKEMLVGPLLVCHIILGIIAMIMLNKECKKLMPVFELPLLDGKQFKKSGHHKIFSTVFYSNVLSLLVSYVFVFLTAWGWGLGSYWLEILRAK